MGPLVCQVVREDEIFGIADTAVAAGRYVLDAVRFELSCHLMLPTHAAGGSG